MYSLSEFSTVKELPDAVTVSEIASSIGLTRSRTYEYLEDKKVPYLLLAKRKVYFKEHLLQAITGKSPYSDLATLKAIKDLPRVFCPTALIKALGISNGLAYTLTSYPGFPAARQRDRIIICKDELIKWLRGQQQHK